MELQRLTNFLNPEEVLFEFCLKANKDLLRLYLRLLNGERISSLLDFLLLLFRSSIKDLAEVILALLEEIEFRGRASFSFLCLI